MIATTPSRDGSNNIFSKHSPFFGGGAKTPTSTRPSTSSPSTNGYSTSANSTISSNSSASLKRQASFNLPTISSDYSFFKNPQDSDHPLLDPFTTPEKRPTGKRKPHRRPPIPWRSPDYAISQPTEIYADTPTSEERVQKAPNRDSVSSTTPFAKMMVAPMEIGERPKTAHQMNAPLRTTPIGTLAPTSPTLEGITYQHIHDMASKRISTLDYLRKAHEGRVYWFNTLLFNKADLSRIPYFDSRKLARRATNYLLLGLSLPTVLDLNSSNALEFLRSLNALLAEFESFQQIHPADGSTSSMSRARIPQMFKRATSATGSKARRTSSAADIGLPMGSESFDSKSLNGSISSAGGASATSFLSSDIGLLPGEEYTYLLTPSLPFDPDFYETFATLCDVLIDCYTRLMGLVSTPKDCGPHVAEMFTKADGRIRKIIVQGVVKEFEDNSRAGVKSEVAGVGKVVLGGLL